MGQIFLCFFVLTSPTPNEVSYLASFHPGPLTVLQIISIWEGLEVLIEVEGPTQFSHY